MRIPSRLGTATIEPKSDYLRSALEARRAKDALASPSPVETRPAPQRTLSEAPPAVSPSISASTDPWIEQAASEDDVLPARSARRRRPSEGALPRLPTQREQQAENDILKKYLFDLKLKFELVTKQNLELKDQVEAAEKRIEELEPLEEVNRDLKADNDNLTLTVQDMEEDINQLSDALDEANKTNKEWEEIQEDAVSNMEQQSSALEEAADIIFQLQTEASQAQEEMKKMQTALARRRESSPSDNWRSNPDLLDGHTSKKPPSRVYSIDESRPSTGYIHSDSDYFSQPGSPQVKSKKASKEQLTFSARERAMAFKDMSISSKQSVKNLKNRMSDASIKNVPGLKEPSPKIPQIQEESEAAAQTARPSKHTPSRRRAKIAHHQQPPMLVTERPATASGTVAAPRTPTTPGADHGLRGLYREPKSTDKSARPSTSYKSPSPLKGSRHQHAASHYITSPQQNSSRSAHTSSNEGLRVTSNESLRTESALSEYTESAVPEYAESIPPPPSIISEPELTEPDSGKWWKDTRKIRTTSGYRPSLGLEALANGPRTPNVPNGLVVDDLGGAPNLFNGAEDEDRFIKKATDYTYGYKRR